MNNITGNAVQNNNIDNIILTALIALTGSGLLVLSVKKPENYLLCYTLLAAFFFNITSFLSILWHKVRWQKRKNIFKRRQEEVIKKHAHKISNTLQAFLVPKVELEAIKSIFSMEDKKISKTEINNIFKSVAGEPQTYELILGLVENLGNEMHREYNAIFRKPLKERFARAKHLADIITDKTRYYSFTIGIVFWFVSLCLHLFT